MTFIFAFFLACTTKGDSSTQTSTIDTVMSESNTPADTSSATTTGPDTSTTATQDSGSAGVTVGPLVLSKRPRNALVITLDTTRRDALGRYAGESEGAALTPFLDGLLSDSVALDDHRSCSDWTWEALLCVQGGRMPYRLGFVWSGETGGASVVPDAVALSTEAMRAEGFQTSLVSAQSFLGSENGLRQGFEQVRYQAGEQASWVVHQATMATQELDADAPWYLHLHFFDPHHLYTPPPAYLAAVSDLPAPPYDVSTQSGYDAMESGWGALSPEDRALMQEHLQVRYAAEVRYLDDQLAVLWETLSEGGWLDETLVMLWTDHGEQLWQHGAPNHGGGLYDEESRAVAFFWSPDLLEPVAWTEPTTHLDLWPTMFAALGVSHDMTLDGHRLGDRPTDEPIFAIHYRGEQTDQSVVVEGQKLLVDWTGAAQRFDLATDPDETINLYTGDAADDALWAVLEPEVEAAASAGGAAPTLPISPVPRP